VIVGIGIDLVEIDRIDEAILRHGNRFAERILSTCELVEYFELQANQRPRFVAKRFSAKEAFAKAFGTGIGRGFGFKDINIMHNALGRPELELSSSSTVFDQLEKCSLYLSITDERSSAASVCVIERSDH
jgi:holo-[acyl-carrier protein] synthase